MSLSCMMLMLRYVSFVSGKLEITTDIINMKRSGICYHPNQSRDRHHDFYYTNLISYTYNIGIIHSTYKPRYPAIHVLCIDVL